MVIHFDQFTAKRVAAECGLDQNQIEKLRQICLDEMKKLEATAPGARSVFAYSCEAERKYFLQFGWGG